MERLFKMLTCVFKMSESLIICEDMRDVTVFVLCAKNSAKSSHIRQNHVGCILAIYIHLLVVFF